jgi:hypothetical protein
VTTETKFDYVTVCPVTQTAAPAGPTTTPAAAQSTTPGAPANNNNAISASSSAPQQVQQTTTSKSTTTLLSTITVAKASSSASSSSFVSVVVQTKSVVPIPASVTGAVKPSASPFKGGAEMKSVGMGGLMAVVLGFVAMIV